MADAMVTGRMTPAKKEAGNRVLASFGMNASQAINKLYDQLIEQGRLPFDTQQKPSYDEAQIQEAQEYAQSLAIPNAERFSRMTDAEIKRDRMQSRYGLTSEGE